MKIILPLIIFLPTKAEVIRWYIPYTNCPLSIPYQILSNEIISFFFCVSNDQGMLMKNKFENEYLFYIFYK